MDPLLLKTLQDHPSFSETVREALEEHLRRKALLRCGEHLFFAGVSPSESGKEALFAYWALLSRKVLQDAPKWRFQDLRIRKNRAEFLLRKCTVRSIRCSREEKELSAVCLEVRLK